MLYMNDYDMQVALERAFRADKTILMGAVHTLSEFREWVDMHSDGWAHWPVPVRSARLLMELIQASEPSDAPDIDPARLKRAYSTLRMFATRYNRGAYGSNNGNLLDFDSLICTVERV